ncbi:MAG: hypothetical protein U0R23_11325 [Candidatus Nanopelagicales bacterium]
MINGGSRRRTFVATLAVGTAALATASPASANTTDLTIRIPGCNGCSVTAVQSVHPGWDAIDDANTWRKSAKVRKGVARLQVPTSRTRGLSFELDAGKYDAGGAVVMLVLHYANKPVGSKVGWFASAQGKRASYCWAGTDAQRARIDVRVQRSVHRQIPRGAPGRYRIRAWASPTQPTLRDDLNLVRTSDGGLGIQQGPYCFDSGSAASAVVSNRVPAGSSVWIKPSGNTYEMLRVWRSGHKMRLYRDEGNYPGDGTYCSWGTLRGHKFVGKEQRVAPDPLRARYTIRMKGARLKVSGLTGSKAQDGLPWRRGSLRQYFQLVPDAAGNTGSWCRTFSPVE